MRAHKGGKFLPAVDPADLEKLWTLQNKELPELSKKYPPPPPGMSHCFEEPRLREIPNLEAASFRLLMLAALRGQGETFLKLAGVTLPGLQDEKPNAATFKAFAVVPMIDVVHHHQIGETPHEGWPVDLEELARLISKSE
jgi:hypothetical protein